MHQHICESSNCKRCGSVDEPKAHVLARVKFIKKFKKTGWVPKLCLHKASGLALAHDPFSGHKQIYFGVMGTRDAKEAYEKWVDTLKAKAMSGDSVKKIYTKNKSNFCACGASAKKSGMCIRCYSEKRNRRNGHKPHKYKSTTLSVTHPDIASELVHQFIGEKETAGSTVKADWKCSICGNLWCSMIKSRVCGFAKCEQCHPGFFRRDLPGIFYLVKRRGQFKIGIMNTGSRRIADHRKNGWTLVDKVIASGHEVAAMETDLKNSLAAKGIQTGMDAFGSCFDGYTEAWRSSDLTVSSIQDLCEKTGANLKIRKVVEKFG